MKKKILIATSMILMGVLVLVGCNGNEEPEILEPTTTEVEVQSEPETTVEEETNITREPVEINIGVLQGPTAMGMVHLMNEADNENIGDDVYNFTLAGSPDEIVPNIIQGNLDIAALPSNLASILYHNTDGAVQVIAINTLGILHIVEAGESITSVEDLRGRTIYASGHASAPEFILNYILTSNGIDPQNDVTIEWLSEHTEVATRMAMSENGVAMLPQPFVTVAQNQNEDLRIVLDLTEEWDQIQANNDGPTSALVMGVLVARREFIEENPEAINHFLSRTSESIQFVNENTYEAAQLIEYYDLFPAPIATRALPYSNITFISGTEMQERFSGYLQVLFDQFPASIGGEMPSEEFYYIP